ncbi:MAG: hypothetical protein PHT34_05635 [Oscillospiraceae bacterium]|nr:hypothetical protein [Oscillospiraceae bacterium]
MTLKLRGDIIIADMSKWAAALKIAGIYLAIWHEGKEKAGFLPKFFAFFKLRF